MRVLPSELLEVISLTPAMRPKERSNGVATDEAMVSGEAPGSEALTIITGKSTCGSGATGSRRKPRNAAQRNGGGNQNGGDRAVDEKGEKAHLRLLFMARKATFHVQRQAVKQEINHRCGKQS